MSLNNINSIQHPEDLDKLKNITDKYLLQSLANLGQRIGVKGDGLSYKYFTFDEIFEDDITLKYSPETHIGYIKYKNINDKVGCEFGITLKSDRNKTFCVDSDINVFNNQYIQQPLKFEIPINNIEMYRENSLLNITDNNFNSILYGKILGAETNSTLENANVEISVNKFNLNTNRLQFAIRAFFLYNDGNSNYYAMNIIEEHKNDDIVDLSDQYDYTLKTYVFNSNIIENRFLRDYFEDSFRYEKLDKDNNPFYLINNVNADLDLDELLHYNGIEDCTIFGIIKNNKLNADIYGVNDNNFVRLDYNTENDQYLTIIEKPEYEDIIIQFDNILSKDDIGLNNRIMFINNDIIYTYSKLLEYYSHKQYHQSKSVLCKHIMFALFSKLNVNEKTDINSTSLYIPLNKKIAYVCNSNNELQIYYSSDVYVTLSDLSIQNNTEIKNLFDSDNIIFGYSGEDKIKVYNFSLNYNRYYTDYVNNININEVYTLPFINSGRKWTINDIDTTISALGKNAGNPNIIIIYNEVTGEGVDRKIKHTIMNAANREKVEASVWLHRKFKVNPNTGVLRNNIKDLNEDIFCECMIPQITKSNYDIFTDALIISLSTTDCLSNVINTSTVNIISSMWTLTNASSDVINNYIQFDYIKNPAENMANREFALDVSFLLNFENVLENAIINMGKNASPEYSIILLKALSNPLYQENPDNSDTNWLTFKNQSADEYVDNLKKMFNDEIFQNIQKRSDIYNNDLNFVLRFNDTVKHIADSDYDISQEEPYITKLSNVTITNNLYPNYNIENVERTEQKVTYTLEKTEEYVPALVKEGNVDADSREITEEVILSDDTVKSITHKLIPNIEEIKINSDVPTKIGNYNEYVFKENVPGIDLKEMFVRNVNTLNRVNIISLKDTIDGPVIYNSYVGSSFDAGSDKGVFEIASSETNINIGNDTLLDFKEKSKFAKQDTCRVKFKNIELNAEKIKASDIIWTEYLENEIKYYNASVKIFGKMDENSFYGNTVANTIQINNADQNNNMLIKSDCIYRNINVYDTGDIYSLLCVNNLINTIFINNDIEKDFHIYNNLYIYTTIDGIINPVHTVKLGDETAVEYYIPVAHIRPLVNNTDAAKYYRTKHNIDITVNKYNGDLYIEIIEPEYTLKHNVIFTEP